MPIFRVISSESPISIDAHSSIHPVRAQSHDLHGVVHVELDDEGLPDLTAPYRAHLRVSVHTLRSGHALQDREMHRRLDATRHPEITVDVVAVAKAEPRGHYRAKARIAVRGQACDVEGEVTIAVDGDRLVVEGEKTIDMRIFGMEPPRLLMLKVHPEVNVRVRVTAHRGMAK